MPIILPEDDEPDARTLAIIDITMMIEGAMTGDEDVDVYDLAGEIVDRLQPPRHGMPMAAIREWQERHRREQNERSFAAISENLERARLGREKPRVRVKAATQHVA